MSLSEFELSFGSPLYLWLLLLVPLFWLVSARSLVGLGRVQQGFAVAGRTLVVATIVCSLADMQLVRRSDRLTVLYLLDQSFSIPASQREAMVDYVNASVSKHLRSDQGDRAGVLVFGSDVAVETPPFDVFVGVDRIETDVDPTYTNLASALSYARGVFRGDTACRVVVVTDGNENLGDAASEARMLTESGVSIDVVPVVLPPAAEVAVEKMLVPARSRKGEPFELRPVLTVSEGANDQPVAGRLRVVKKSGNRDQVLVEQRVELAPGKSILSLSDTLDQAGFFTYEAHFLPEDAKQDRVVRNNVASAYTFVQGAGRVLLIHSADNPESGTLLAERLRRNGLEVQMQSTAQLYASLVDLQDFDCVVLVDVARTTDVGETDLVSFSDDQIRMLVENTESLGCGLVVIGGPNSYGAGGWANTDLEKALPVDCTIKDAKVVPVGALGLVIDRSGSMQGDKIQYSKAAAVAAIKSLGRRDLATVVAFDSQPRTIVPLRRVEDVKLAARSIQRLSASGGTDLYPAFDRAVSSLQQADAAVKHLIVLTDGQTPNPGFNDVVARARQAKITISCVAVGQDADYALLSKIAAGGGGRFYSVRSASAIPRIFMKEALRVARPLVRDLDPPRQPVVVSEHEMLWGLEGQLPPIRGFVMTTLKSSPLVEMPLRSPVPANQENSAILATWTYGLGRVVAFTSDAGRQWTTPWNEWDQSDALFAQMVRWAMRPTDGARHYSLSTSVVGNETTVVIDHLDADTPAEDLALRMEGHVVGPDNRSRWMEIEQTAPHRFVGKFQSQDAGTYIISIATGDSGNTMLRTGVSVGYSREFVDRETNLPLLETLAGLTPIRFGWKF